MSDAIKSEYVGDQWGFVIKSVRLKMSDRTCTVYHTYRTWNSKQKDT